MDILIGLIIGVLCGIVPLIFGLIIKNNILGIAGLISSAISGIVFAILDKSPFTAIGISIVFIVFLFANYKKKNSHHDDYEHEEFFDDD